MFHKIEIKEGAFIFSDAHYSSSRPELLSCMNDIQAKRLNPSQIIFMGDIFDSLFGGVPFSYIRNQELINSINKLAKTIEIIYLEGNHDFRLSKIFKNIKIIPINQQPLSCSFADKKIYLAHGDFDADIGYLIYTSLIRNPFIILFLKMIDNLTNHAILTYIDNHLGKKEDCNEFEGFYNFIQNRIINNYKCDYFIEGHFHQNKKINFKELNYINLAAFACNQRYFIVKSSKDKELLEEKKFSKEI